jgi:hypothetical protein
VVVTPYDWRYQPLGDQYWSNRVNRTFQSGWHRRGSYWGGVGPAFEPGASRTGRLTDVTPTIAGMLGLPAFTDISGAPLGHGSGRVPAWSDLSA